MYNGIFSTSSKRVHFLCLHVYVTESQKTDLLYLVNSLTFFVVVFLNFIYCELSGNVFTCVISSKHGCFLSLLNHANLIIDDYFYVLKAEKN